MHCHFTTLFKSTIALNHWNTVVIIKPIFNGFDLKKSTIFLFFVIFQLIISTQKACLCFSWLVKVTLLPWIKSHFMQFSIFTKNIQLPMDYDFNLFCINPGISRNQWSLILPCMSDAVVMFLWSESFAVLSAMTLHWQPSGFTNTQHRWSNVKVNLQHGWTPAFKSVNWLLPSIEIFIRKHCCLDARH